MTERIVEDVERMADLFVAVLAKAMTNQVLDEEFDGQVTTSQLLALRYLFLNEQPLMSELAEGLDISYPAATKTVERLVKKGLAMREDDPADRRVVRVRLTERGVNLVREVMAERNQRLTRVLGALESADREALFRGLGAFIATALRTVDDRTVVEAICLHCGKEHRDDCSVSAALDRPEAQPATS